MIFLLVLLVVLVDAILTIQELIRNPPKMSWKTYAVGILAVVSCGFLWTIGSGTVLMAVVSAILCAPIIKLREVSLKNNRFLPSSGYEVFLGLMSVLSLVILSVGWLAYDSSGLVPLGF